MNRVKSGLEEVRVVVKPERCKECEICIDFCPSRIIVKSREFNVLGYRPVKVESQNKCIKCRLCELLCPDFAIYLLS